MFFGQSLMDLILNPDPEDVVLEPPPTVKISFHVGHLLNMESDKKKKKQKDREKIKDKKPDRRKIERQRENFDPGDISREIISNDFG